MKRSIREKRTKCKMLKHLCNLEKHDERVWNVNWDWKGETLASCGSDRQICLWKNRKNADDSTDDYGDSSSFPWCCTCILRDGHTKTVRSSCFSPCGRYIASTSFDALTVIWEKSPESVIVRNFAFL